MLGPPHWLVHAHTSKIRQSLVYETDGVGPTCIREQGAERGMLCRTRGRMTARDHWMGGAGMGRSRYFGSTSFWLSREIHGRRPRVLWPSNGCSKHCTLDSVELKGLQLRDSIACSALWLSQKTSLIAVNSSKPCGKATRLQLRVCGNGYKSIVLVISRLFFLGQNPFLSDTSPAQSLHQSSALLSTPL